MGIIGPNGHAIATTKFGVEVVVEPGSIPEEVLADGRTWHYIWRLRQGTELDAQFPIGTRYIEAEVHDLVMHKVWSESFGKNKSRLFEPSPEAYETLQGCLSDLTLLGLEHIAYGLTTVIHVKWVIPGWNQKVTLRDISSEETIQQTFRNVYPSASEGTTYWLTTCAYLCGERTMRKYRNAREEMIESLNRGTPWFKASGERTTGRQRELVSRAKWVKHAAQARRDADRKVWTESLVGNSLGNDSKLQTPARISVVSVPENFRCGCSTRAGASHIVYNASVMKAQLANEAMGADRRIVGNSGVIEMKVYRLNPQTAAQTGVLAMASEMCSKCKTLYLWVQRPADLRPTRTLRRGGGSVEFHPVMPWNWFLVVTKLGKSKKFRQVHKDGIWW